MTRQSPPSILSLQEYFHQCPFGIADIKKDYFNQNFKDRVRVKWTGIIKSRDPTYLSILCPLSDSHLKPFIAKFPQNAFQSYQQPTLGSQCTFEGNLTDIDVDGQTVTLSTLSEQPSHLPLSKITFRAFHEIFFTFDADDCVRLCNSVWKDEPHFFELIQIIDITQTGNYSTIYSFQPFPSDSTPPPCVIQQCRLQVNSTEKDQFDKARRASGSNPLPVVMKLTSRNERDHTHQFEFLSFFSTISTPHRPPTQTLPINPQTRPTYPQPKTQPTSQQQSGARQSVRPRRPPTTPSSTQQPQNIYQPY
ncbi:hypothetical protein BLNAU_8304 [Blattamonas nauphoetae]|uniref:Uncharacterized protein n=1 Tax=Blattamonas nauphoetae TaxID=2049346 RepID=A0ABQ9XYW0_9EUKA|nr:hypothetical protein BLNAU_8304 [Blattamonas nauphoetae]